MTETEKARMRELEAIVAPVMSSVADHLGNEMDAEVTNDMRAQMLGIPLALIDAMFVIRDGGVWRSMHDPRVIAGTLLREVGLADEDWTKAERFVAFYNAETCRNWSKDPEVNELFIRHVQNYCNDRLKAHGFLFLNQVMAELGLEWTARGQVVGWFFVNANLVEIKMDEADENGGHVLEFNVDGYILDKIDG